MVAEGASPSTFIDANGKTREHVYQSPFDRTFFLGLFLGDLAELGCR
jgi:hypothetical protein